MPEYNERLVHCFESVFPALTPEQIVGLDDASGVWDSLASVTLVSVVEEEFGVQISPDTMAQLTSFDAFRAYLQATGQGSGSNGQE